MKDGHCKITYTRVLIKETHHNNKDYPLYRILKKMHCVIGKIIFKRRSVEQKSVLASSAKFPNGRP